MCPCQRKWSICCSLQYPATAAVIIDLAIAVWCAVCGNGNTAAPAGREDVREVLRDFLPAPHFDFDGAPYIGITDGGRLDGEGDVAFVCVHHEFAVLIDGGFASF
jgi:hypothetical protein